MVGSEEKLEESEKAVLEEIMKKERGRLTNGCGEVGKGERTECRKYSRGIDGG